MDLKGQLRIFEPISVLQFMNLSQSSGALRFKVRGNSASVYFEKGKVTYAQIDNRSVRLGEYLVDKRVINAEDLERALKNKKRGKRIGTALVEMGLVVETVLVDAVEEQIKQVIYEILRWNDGTFEFSSGKQPDTQDIFIDIPLDHLILEGLKRMDEAEDAD